MFDISVSTNIKRYYRKTCFYWMCNNVPLTVKVRPQFSFCIGKAFIVYCVYDGQSVIVTGLNDTCNKSMKRNSQNHHFMTIKHINSTECCSGCIYIYI